MGIDPERTLKTQGRPVRYLLSPWLYHGYRLFIGGLFLYAGATKLADSVGFAEAIAAYKILPDPLVPCAALGLPLVEVGAGMGTLLNRRWAILGIMAMMLLFLGVLGYGAAVGLDIDCGCFGPEKSAPAQRIDTVPLLDLSGDGQEILDGPIVLIEPDPARATEDGTCSEESQGPSRLRSALYRDIFMFLGVLYLVAWPDLRRRNGMDPNIHTMRIRRER
jgi:uncharacterized membrane protein YphA (DoxX/SURF4 family)